MKALSKSILSTEKIYEKLVCKLNSNKKTILQCILFTFIFGMLAHSYMYFDNNINHDSLSEFYGNSEWKIAIGRIFIPLYQKLFRGFTTIPFLIGILSLTYLSITVLLITKIFNIKKGLQIALISGFMTVNVTVIATTASFIHDLDCDMLALLLSVLGVFCFQKFKLGFLFGAIPIAFSLGLYQSYISVAITLIIFIMIFDILNDNQFKLVFLKGIKAIAMLLLSGVIYFITLKATFFLSGVALASGGYNSLDIALSMSISDFLFSLLETIKISVENILLPLSIFSKKTVFVIQATLLSACGVCILRIIVKKRIRIKEALLSFILILLLPISMNICHILTNGTSHNLMYYAFNLLYLFVLLITFDNEQKFKSHKKLSFDNIIKLICVALISVVIFGNIRYANLSYLAKDAQYDSVLSYYTVLVSKMDDIDGYTAGKTKVAFCGTAAVHSPEAFSAVGEFTGGGAAFLQQKSQIWYQTAYFKYVLMRPDLLIPSDGIAQLSSVKEMPIYPQKGSMQIIGDVLVVKLG